MRWKTKHKGPYRPWFAFFPLKTGDGEVIWLERIWVRFAGDYSTWAPWEENPNDEWERLLNGVDGSNSPPRSVEDAPQTGNSGMNQ